MITDQLLATMPPARVTSFRLVTICDDRTANDGTLAKMLDSLAAQGAPARVWLRCHGVKPRRIEQLRTDPRIAHVSAIPTVRPLSEARNAILGTALEGIEEHEIVAFPDDDCWYAPGTLAAVAKIFAMSPAIDFLLGDISPKPTIENVFCDLTPADIAACIDRAKSGGLFVRPRAFRDLIESDGYLFDTRFGLGARAGAAEEPDFTLRLHRIDIQGLLTPHLFVGHPVKPSRPAQYWHANLALLAKHAGSIEGDGYLWNRMALRAARGLRYIASGDISPAAYVKALYLMCCALFWDRKTPPQRG